MQSYDFLMLAVLIGCMVFGAWKGMAWQVASLTSIVASYFAAVNFSGAIAPLISAEAPWNKAVAMLVVYVASSLGIWLAFRLVAGVIDSVKLRDFDRQIGAMFGAAKGVLLCLVITFFALSLSETARGMVHASRAGSYMTWFLRESDPYLPVRVREVVGPYIDRLEDKLHQSGSPTPSLQTQPQPMLPGQPPRSFPSSGGPSGNLSDGSWWPNTSLPGDRSTGTTVGGSPRTASGSTADGSQPRDFIELGGRIFRELAGGSEPTPANRAAPDGRIDNPSYDARSSVPTRPANPPPPDGWNDFFSRGLDALRTIEEFGTSPSPAVPQRMRR